MAMPYDYLSGWFEILNDDCDYLGWSQYFIEGLQSLHAGKEGLELGCGSGAFCRLLQKAGYSMTGADSSLGMLNRAAVLSREEGLNIPFVQADASSLRVPSRFDFILSPNDCFNYIRGEKLVSAFAHIRSSLKKGGIFWFDVSSEYNLREKVANTTCCDDRDEVTYLALNTLFEDRVETDVTLFVKEKDLFRRYDEKHVRYIHTENTLVSALEKAGFAVLRTEGHRGERKEGSDRLNVICQRT